MADYGQTLGVRVEFRTPLFLVGSSVNLQSFEKILKSLRLQ